jgi:hypothetical protein
MEKDPMDTNSGNEFSQMFNNSSAPAPAQEQATPVVALGETSAPAPEANPVPVPAQEPVRESPRMVPLPELDKVRERARAAESQVSKLSEAVRFLTAQQQQYQQPAIDPLVDPEAAYIALQQRMEHGLQAVQQNFDSRLEAMRLTSSLESASKTYGRELVEEASRAAFERGLDGHFASRANPHEEAVSWYQAERLKNEVGNDPAAYKERVKAELRAELLAELRAGTPAPQNLPPSLASATKASSTMEVVPDARDFFKSMMTHKRG